MKRRRGRDVHGIVPLDKPAECSSNQAVQQVRRLFDARKAGHTGSLDPFATGMLPICLGEATKTAGFMLDADKRYRAVARLGEATSTGDPEGDVINRLPVPECGPETVRRALEKFQGEISQTPPMYSAIKHRGRRLYHLAREGIEVEREPRRVTIFSLELKRWERPLLEFEVHCSKGTYVRTLAEDIAARLGSCAHLVLLRRLGVGAFDAGKLVTLEALEALARKDELDQALLPADAGLGDWPVLELDEAQAARFRHGNTVASHPESEAGNVRVYGPGGMLMGLGVVRDDGRLHPRRVFHIAAAGTQA